MTDLSPVGRRPVARRAFLGTAAASAFWPAGAGAAPSAAINGVLIGKDGWLFADWDALRGADLKMISRVTALMNETIGILKSKGIATAVSLLPSRSRLFGDHLPDGVTPKPEAARRYAQALQELRAPGTLVPDLTVPILAARRARPQDPLFFKADTHWMPAGAEVAALEFARQVHEKVPLPPSSLPGTQFGTPVEMEHVNDLARLLPAAQREQFPVQTYMMRPVQGGAGEDALIDDVAADVALLGNSYMQPRYGFSSILSNQLMRPVSLMWDVNQVGPYRMMLRYLASGMFRQQRPRLIVWNIHELDLEYQPDRQDIWGQNAVPPRTFLSEVRRMVGA